MLEFPALRDHWYIACRSKRLRKTPLRCSLFGQPIVLFRSADGKASALRDLCPHRNAPLSSGRLNGDRIVCPYHGWQFDGGGICRHVPGLDGDHRHPTRDVACYAVREQQGLVWVYANPAEGPRGSPYRIPYFGAPGFRSLVGEFPVLAELPDALENFLDATHTHIVHRGLVRRESRRKPVLIRVQGYDDRAEAEYVEEESQESGFISRLFGGGIDGSVDRFILPSIAQLEHRAAGRVKFMLTMIVTPEDENSLRVYTVASGRCGLLRYIQALTVGRLVLNHVMGQDREILRLQTLNKKLHEPAGYTSTKLDLLRPHIMRLLRHGSSDPSGRTIGAEREVEMLI
jgi:phenylpropionate dioxygenase-like ring-hydroxylating dioxygenase large terminal subunit